MKKILLLFILALQAFTTFGQTANEARSGKLVQVGAELPQMRLMQLDSSIINTKNLDPNKNVILMLFNPTCEHCIDFTKSFIAQRETAFKDFEFVLMTGDQMLPYLSNFIKAVDYKTQHRMTIGVDLDKKTFELFIYDGLPQLMLYDTNKKLLKLYTRDTKMETILATYNLAIPTEVKIADKQSSNKKNKRRAARIKNATRANN